MRRFVLGVLLCLIFSSTAWALAFDAKFEKGSAAQASPFSFVSDVGTVSGSVTTNQNRCLIAQFSTDLIVTSPGMTWNGQAMNAIGTVVSTTPTYQTYLFELHTDATIASGAQTLGATWTSVPLVAVIIGAQSYYDCDQTAGFQNFTSATGTSTAPSITVTTANGNIIAAFSAQNNGALPTIAAGTSDWIDGNFNGGYMGAHNASAATSQTITWTTDNVAWGVAGIDVIAFSGSGGAAKVGSMLIMFQMFWPLMLLLILTPCSLIRSHVTLPIERREVVCKVNSEIK